MFPGFVGSIAKKAPMLSLDRDRGSIIHAPAIVVRLFDRLLLLFLFYLEDVYILSPLFLVKFLYIPDGSKDRNK